jgi:diguanylate cyclase (GGDEF)-like protein
MVDDRMECNELQYFLFALIATLLVSVYFNLRQREMLRHRQNSESSLIKKAYFNPITELPNRENVELVFKEQIARTNRRQKSFIVAVVKVTNYHDIKIRSQERAQQVMIEAGERLLDATRDEDVVAHITENGFVILFNEYLESENFDIILNRINHEFEKQFQDDKGLISIKISVGSSTYPDDEKDAQGLINEATRKALN